MAWFVTGVVDEYLAAAGQFLRAEPVRNTVILSVTEGLRVRAVGSDRLGRRLTGADQPLFGWWQQDGPGSGAVRGAFLATPGFPVFLSSMSSAAAAGLAGELATAGRSIPGVNAEQDAAEAFADTWRRRTGDSVTVQRRMRLHRLDRLVGPDPPPDGAPRVAGERDRDLLIGWTEAFAREVDEPAGHDRAADVDERLGYGGLTIWEARGDPVSMAGVSRAVGGMARVGPVYTPPALRGRGYAGGVTAAVSQAALDAGATQVVLYTDLANPTSNALYQRLGYRPVEDRVVLSFEPGTRT
jgi:RimJ/RimL family protein N-acetyltransferase